MYRPDPAIVRKIQEFDRHLFVVWNNRKQYFEIWRHQIVGRSLVTAVVRALYEEGGGQVFVPLDERILGVLHEPWGSGSHLHWFDREEQRSRDQLKHRSRSRKDDWRHFAGDMWQTLNNRFVTTHASKNSGRPNFNKTSPYSQWVAPDVRHNSSRRLFSRSAGNAKLYGYRGK